MSIRSPFVSRITLLRDKVPSFESYPFSLPAIVQFRQLNPHPKITFFIGENGSGKSTLLEAIAVALGFNAEGGSKNFSFNTHPSHSVLYEYLRIARGFPKPRTGFFLRAESFFNVASEIENLDEDPTAGPPIKLSYGGRSLHAQSHGESFMSLLQHRFSDKGLYILDEPEAALSPQRQLAALARMHELVQGGSQFLIATHSPILMAYPDADIYQFDESGISKIAYEDTDHFNITRNFLANPQRMLDILMGE